MELNIFRKLDKDYLVRQQEREELIHSEGLTTGQIIGISSVFLVAITSLAVTQSILDAIYIT